MHRSILLCLTFSKVRGNRNQDASTVIAPSDMSREILKPARFMIRVSVCTFQVNSEACSPSPLSTAPQLRWVEASGARPDCRGSLHRLQDGQPRLCAVGGHAWHPGPCVTPQQRGPVPEPPVLPASRGQEISPGSLHQGSPRSLRHCRRQM